MSTHPEYKAHLFICTNVREVGECCGKKGAQELRQLIKDKVTKEPDWKGKVRVNASGCLNQCSNGIAAVIYPSQHWHLNLTASATDADHLVQKIACLFPKDSIARTP